MQALDMGLEPGSVREQEVRGAAATAPGLLQDLKDVMMGVQPMEEEGGDRLHIF